MKLTNLMILGLLPILFACGPKPAPTNAAAEAHKQIKADSNEKKQSEDLAKTQTEPPKKSKEPEKRIDPPNDGYKTRPQNPSRDPNSPDYEYQRGDEDKYLTHRKITKVWPNGVVVYRMGQMQITEAPDGTKLYLPDYF